MTLITTNRYNEKYKDEKKEAKKIKMRMKMKMHGQVNKNKRTRPIGTIAYNTYLVI